MKKYSIFALLLLLTAILCPSPTHASGLGTPFLQCFGGTLSATDSISCTCTGPQTCASTGELLIISTRDDDNSTAITHAASDSVNGTTGWHQAGCSIGNQREALCLFWKIATTNTALTFTVNFTPTGHVQNGELQVSAFPNTPAASPVDCFTGSTFSANAGTQTTGSCTTTFTTDTLIAEVACASPNTNEFTPVAPFATYFGSSLGTSWEGEIRVVSTIGTFTASWTTLSGCTSLASIPGTMFIIGLKAADGAPSGHSFPMVIKYRSTPQRRIPFDTRRRKLQIVSI